MANQALGVRRSPKTRGSPGGVSQDRIVVLLKIAVKSVAGFYVRPITANLFDTTRRLCSIWCVKFTRYFQTLRSRPDRAIITDLWIQFVIDHPVKEVIQEDGRIRRWAPIDEAEGRYLRVILLPDGETVHNAFFDRSFTP